MLMTTNTVPSLACKGNNKTIGFWDGSFNSGLIGRAISSSATVLDTTKNGYGTNVGTLPQYAYARSGGYTIGLSTDASKSGIITNTGTMSAVSSRAIIKY